MAGSRATSAARLNDPPSGTTGTAQPEPEFGTQASIVGLILIEPVAQPVAEPVLRPVPAKPMAGTAPEVERPVLVGFTQHPAAASGAMGAPARWPALSRVRDGLQAAERTGAG